MQMSKQQIIGLIAAAAVFVFVAVVSAVTNAYTSQINLSNLAGSVSTFPVSGEYVGVIDISGVMVEQETSIWTVVEYDHRRILSQIDEMMNAKNNRGILLNLNTPGGGVYESEELYLKLMEYRDATARPVYVYMDRIAASGGYYISMASEGRVFANRNCITASIGVTMGYINVHGLIEDLGIRDFSITSGEHKDIMSMFKEDVDTDNLILQSMVDEYFDRFAEIVALGRDMSDSEVRAVADGRIMTATQALDAGLIDDVMTYSEVLDYIRGELGANINIYQPATAPDFWSSLFGFVAQTRTQSDAQAIISALEQRGNGRFMYHATIS